MPSLLKKMTPPGVRLGGCERRKKDMVEKIKLGNTRVTGKEQYYTPPELADSIMARVMLNVDDDSPRTFLEPAGGTGNFVEAAKKYGFRNTISFDIEPKHKDVAPGDFLYQNLDLTGAVCITNPPFGRNNSLSIPFFNKAAQHSEIIAFIVPRSWRKWSVLNRLDLAFELIDDWDLSIDYVDDQGNFTHGAGNLRTCVQVWKRKEGFTRNLVKVEDFGFVEKTSPEEADVSFTLFGYGCGTVKTEFDRKRNSTQTFFRLLRPDTLKALQSVDFSKFYRHTSYIEALSMVEINYLLNEYAGEKSFGYSSVPGEPNYLGLQYREKGL
jgi:predicted RNA methylase